MNEIKKRKFERLSETFKRNFKITELYAEYLTRYPEIITEDMINALTEDGETSKEEAIVALLSEIFALDFANVEDRRLIMDYLTPSVRILDTKKYENDPYYKNIKLSDLSLGSWEIKNEKYSPYQAVICDDMMLHDDFREVPPLGFFTEEFHFPAILEGGNEWMTLTPVDLDTCSEAIEISHGRVVTFGLGLGYFAYMASEKSNVESVTVVELSADVIKLFTQHILPQMPNRDKIRIVNSDAFEYAEKIMPNENFDVAFVDTWRDASDGTPMYKRMKRLEHLSPKTTFLYWIENFLISRSRAENFSKIYSDYEENGDLPKSYEEILDRIREI